MMLMIPWVMVMVRISRLSRLSLLTLETSVLELCAGLLMSLLRSSFFLVDGMVLSRLTNSVLRLTTIPPFWKSRTLLLVWMSSCWE
jgi:hypothetical protein